MTSTSYIKVVAGYSYNKIGNIVHVKLLDIANVLPCLPFVQLYAYKYMFRLIFRKNQSMHNNTQVNDHFSDIIAMSSVLYICCIGINYQLAAFGVCFEKTLNALYNVLVAFEYKIL